jgi:hypothetical protein
MAVFALWHGGPSFSNGSIENGDLEKFRSIRDARTALAWRYESNGSMLCAFDYVDREPTKVYVPSVTTDSTMDVYMYDPREACDPCPSLRLSFGPRGGICRENY